MPTDANATITYLVRLLENHHAEVEIMDLANLEAVVHARLRYEQSKVLERAQVLEQRRRA